MDIQDLRDIVAQINAAHPTENSSFPILLEGKGGFLVVTLMSHDDIKIQLHQYNYCGYNEEWIAIAPFYELSDITWNMSKVHPDDAVVSITPSNGQLKVRCEANDDYMGDTLEWLETLPLQILCLVAYFYRFTVKWRNPWNKVTWRAEELLEALELLYFDEDEFEAYHECGINGYDWFHLQSAALIARQNTIRKQAKYPALCGINISAVNNNLEVSAMCPTATTYRLIWHEDPYWENFSFTVPVELVDQITQSIDVSAIDSVVFFVSPELIKVKVHYVKRIVDNGMAALTACAYFFVKPIKGRYWYPKVPVNQITERSVAVKKELLHEALRGATKATTKAHDDEVLLQVQGEKLYVHGLEGSFEICADCTHVPDSQIRVSCTQILDMLKYVNSCTLFLDFPEKVTQALMLGNTSGVQYLIFGLVKGDYILTPDEDATQNLLTIPGLIPGEPDLELQLAELSVLETPLSEAEALHLKNELLHTYGLSNEWDYHAAIDEMCDRFIEAQRVLEDRSPSPALNSLSTELKQMLDDYEYAIATYQAGDPNSELYYHGGLCRKDLDIEIEAINSLTTSVKLLASRIQEYSLRLEKTYTVRMTFA